MDTDVQQEMDRATSSLHLMLATASDVCKPAWDLHGGDAALVWRSVCPHRFHPTPCSPGYKAPPPQAHLFVLLQY